LFFSSPLPFDAPFLFRDCNFYCPFLFSTLTIHDHRSFFHRIRYLIFYLYTSSALTFCWCFMSSYFDYRNCSCLRTIFSSILSIPNIENVCCICGWILEPFCIKKYFVLSTRQSMFHAILLPSCLLFLAPFFVAVLPNIKLSEQLKQEVPFTDQLKLCPICPVIEWKEIATFIYIKSWE